jgi:uncharacterized protein (TIGR02147 family)
MAAKLPNIFEYNDFRKFLNDYQEAKRAADRRFTKSAICKKLGLPNSRSYFNDVLNGKLVSTTYIERFVRLFDFDVDEARFFRVLVKFNQADDVYERELYFDQLISLNKTPKQYLDKNVFEYYTEWYHSTIRALLETFDFTEDYGILAKKLYPPVSEKKVRASIELLKRLGLVKKDKKGFLRVHEKSIVAGKDIQKELIKQYQLKCFDAARQALMKNRTMHQVFSTNTISISKEGYERLKKKLQRFKLEIRSLVHKDENPADRVYELNFQLYPKSKQDKKK